MPPGRAGSLESLRRLNRLRVIRALREEGQISRAEIARRTGLSRSTVSSLVADLQADGLVVERPEPGSAYGAQGGRPPILLSFDASAGAALGVDFGHSHLRVAVSDLASTILAERTRALDTDHDAQEGLDMATELVVETLADAGVARETVIGAGMGLPGPIDQGHGTVGSSAILPGWIGMTAAEELQRRLEIPVIVDNDANLGALAEAAFGAGPRRRRPRLPEGLLGDRRRPDPQRAPVPRHAPAWPASSGTCSSTPTASSAAAATAAAWRRSPRPARSSTACGPIARRRPDHRRRARGRPRPATPPAGAPWPTRAARSARSWPCC